MLMNWTGVSHVMALALIACGSEKATGPSASTQPEIIVSAPIPRASLPGGAGQSGSVVFVSGMPHAVAGAAAASARGEDGPPATTSVREGGFDPIAVGAASGDVVALTLTDSGGATVSEDLTVRSGRPPRVVRTSPAPRRTDVPLNAVIKVVFSAPMMLESVVDGVRLLTGGTEVPATVVASDANGLIFDLQPAAALQPRTSYELVIEATVSDVNGTSLGEAQSTSFTTVTPPAHLGTLQVVVRTAGENIDLDGYVVQVWREDPNYSVEGEGTVAVDGTLLLPGQVPGTHYVYLMGISDHCVVDDSAMRQVAIAEGTTRTETFVVRCTSIRASDPAGTGTVRIHIYSLDTIPGRTPGVRQGCDSDPFCPRALVTWTEPAVFRGVASGLQGFFLERGHSGCGADALPLSEVFIEVRAGETKEFSFPVRCHSG